MFSDVLYFVLNILFSLFGIALILRAWMYAIRLHPFNPYSQAILRGTNWLVTPVRNVIKPSNRVDWPSLVACWLTALVFLLLTWVVLTGQLPSIEGLTRSLIAAVITMAKWAFNIVLWVTLIQAILSWVNPMAPIMPLLQTLTAPLLDPIRRIMPNLGGLDLSPLVLLLVAQVAIMVLQRLAFSFFGV
ncbi:MAG TPA: YggT family protein [Burkholderiaceae bacterium]|nr:YggT family protein [Burkholderiaceae bacterium]